MKSILVTLFLSGILPAASYQQKDSQEDLLATAAITFDREMHPFIDVMVNGKGPFSIGLDTGATVTVFSTKFAKEVGVKGSGRAKLTCGKVEVETDYQVSNQYGGFSMTGYDLMKDHVVTFDYANKQILFQKEFRKKEDDKETYTFDMNFLSKEKTRCGIFAIDTKINGKGPFNFIFDTGAGWNVINPKLAKELGLKGKKPKLDWGLAELEFKEVVGEVMSPGAASGLKWDGIIGSPIIEHIVAVIDYPNKKMHIKRAKKKE